MTKVRLYKFVSKVVTGGEKLLKSKIKYCQLKINWPSASKAGRLMEFLYSTSVSRGVVSSLGSWLFRWRMGTVEGGREWGITLAKWFFSEPETVQVQIICIEVQERLRGIVGAMGLEHWRTGWNDCCLAGRMNRFELELGAHPQAPVGSSVGHNFNLKKDRQNRVTAKFKSVLQSLHIPCLMSTECLYPEERSAFWDS